MGRGGIRGYGNKDHPLKQRPMMRIEYWHKLRLDSVKDCVNREGDPRMTKYYGNNLEPPAVETI